ncbi:hypothetical protein C5167_025255, partial [Papaver somniferum]
MVDIKKFLTKKTVISLALVQFVSLLITSTGFSSSELSRKGIRIYQKKKLQTKWYYYLLLALFDVEGNFLVVKAYQYTSLTSVMLLDCWTIPCVILFTWLFLKTKYRIRKFIGVAVCVAGLVLVVFSDVHAADRAGGSHPIKGDLLVIAGATLYGVTNTRIFGEKCDRVEVMAMLGLFGAIISAIQIAILERNELKAIHWSAGALLPYSGFAAAMFLFYSTVPILLQISGSTMLNLSLLTSDMWAVLIRIFAYHEKVDWMYFIAFSIDGQYCIDGQYFSIAYCISPNSAKKNTMFSISSFASAAFRKRTRKWYAVGK